MRGRRAALSDRPGVDTAAQRLEAILLHYVSERSVVLEAAQQAADEQKTWAVHWKHRTNEILAELSALSVALEAARQELAGLREERDELTGALALAVRDMAAAESDADRLREELRELQEQKSGGDGAAVVEEGRDV
jgi:chromosome segregation ATPase